MSERPEQTPEGRLIEAATIKDGRSIRQLAANAKISDARWRHIVKGYQPLGGGRYQPVTAPAQTLARMAFTLGLDPDDLDSVGRPDAAQWLAGIQAAHERAAPKPAGDDDADEIQLIVDSDLPAARKLELIRMVLRLRSQAEAETAGSDEQRTA